MNINVRAEVFDKIHTIKVFRNAFSIGLREAKELVEALIDGAVLQLSPEDLITLVNENAQSVLDVVRFRVPNSAAFRLFPATVPVVVTIPKGV